MEFRLATTVDQDLVESLWAYCFEPRENPFFQWYFKDGYDPQNVLLGFQDNRLVCDTHLNPYILHLRGKDIPTSYIVGLATHPAARRGGLGAQLLTAALAEMKRRGHYINLLMPSKAAFYQPYGWDLYCHQWREKMELTDLRPLTDRTVHFGFVTDDDQWQWLASVYEKYTEKLNGYVVRDEASWRRHIRGQLVEGCIAVVFEGDQPIGYVFYQLGAPTIICAEFVYTTYKGKKGLLNYLYNHRSQGERVEWSEGIHDQSYRFYPDGKQGHETMPFMTGRVVDVIGALESLAYPAETTVTLSFSVTDPLAQWNDGSFTLSVEHGLATVQPALPVAGTATMDVGALGLLIFGALTATELVQYDKLTGSEDEIRILDNLFPKMNTYINEWY